MKKPLLIFALASLGFSLCSCNHSHTWGSVTYTWSEDHSSCTAKRVCKDDPNHIEEETATSTSKVFREATCTTRGEIIYTAKFNNAEFDTQTYVLSTSPINHKYGSPTYTWADDNSQCIAMKICQNDKSHIITETAKSFYKVVEEPTYTSEGIGEYSVTFKDESFEKQTKQVSIAKLDQLVFTLKDDNTYSVKAHSTSISGDIVIPHTYNDINVTSIEKDGFLNCKSIGKVTLGNKLTLLNQNAFAGSSVTEISLPSSITSMGRNCFSNCESLTKVSILGNLAMLPAATFYKCSSLKTVNLSNNIGGIGERSNLGCFSYCTSLEEIYLPDSVALIGYNAFFGCTSLKKVHFPNYDAEYCSSCFAGCTSLRDFPTRYSELAYGSFSNCHSLTQITLINAYYSGSNHFSSCKGLKRVIVAEGVKTLPEQAFIECSALTQVILPSTLTNAGSLTFCLCTQLTEVINKSQLSLSKDDEVFYGCTSLEYIITSESSSKMSTLEGITFYIRTNGKIIFVDYENKDCEKLTIPSYITEIGSAALYNFTSLKSLSYEGTVETWSTLTKGSDWNFGTLFTFVTCTNGEAPI